MKRKQDLIYQFLLIFFVLFLFWLVVDSEVLFGSKTDWISQHVVFPEYLRTLFYDTGELFPNFAPHIGAGQNIYVLSYYGLLNPIIMLSYLFPQVSMVDYIITTNYVLFLCTGLLFYHFMRSHKKSPNISLLTTLLVIFSSCLLFHFHRHFMFVNYMPFLILGLMGIDRYFKTNKKWIYMLSIFMMIMMSYYYSVTGIFVMVIYGIYQYIRVHEKITVREFLKDGIRFIIPIVVAILMAGVLLLPTAYTILNGRTDQTTSIQLASLFIPDLNLDGLLYGTYSLGFTSVILFALIENLFSEKRENKWLSIAVICVLVFPIFIYLLNGTLYVRDKILLPFLPLMGILLADFLEMFKNKELHLKVLYISTAVIVLLALIQNEQEIFFYIDIVIMWIILFIGSKIGYRTICIGTIILVAFTNFIIANASDQYVTKEEYNTYFSKEKQELIDQVLEKEDKIVRSNQLDDPLYTINKIYRDNYYQTSIYSSTYNANYRNFYDSVFEHPLSHRNSLITSQTNNILYQMFMGVQYVTTKRKAPVGYRKVAGEEGETSIYKNANVLPIGYVSYQTLNEEVFDKIEFPYKDEVLLNQTVTKNSSNDQYETHIKEIDLQTTPKYIESGIDYRKTDQGYHIDVSETSMMQLKLDHSLKNKILIISFDVKNQPDCSVGDLRITINQVKNKLTCSDWLYQNHNDTFKYVISSSKATATLTIGFDPGSYDLENIHVYELDYNDIKDVKKSKDEWKLNTDKSKGDVLTGKVTAKQDGYFTTSIPYDEGFTVLVDGKEVEYEMVNKGFVGFPIEEGTHTVTLEYQSPWFRAGVFLSGIGLLSALVIILFDIKKRK